MSIHSLLARPAARKAHRARIALESLEERATPSRTLTVDDDHAQNHNAQYTSIQAAVNAASPGDTIRVYAGDYREQVTIPARLNGLTLTAVGNRDNVVIDPAAFTADATQAVVHVAGAKKVEINGFVISGQNAPAGDGNGADYGVLVDGGGSADVENNHITAIRDRTLSGVQEGIGVQFGFTNGMGTILSTGRGEAEGNLIDDYQKGGVVVIGTGSDADVERNVIRGSGPTEVIAQNGVQVSDGATADVERNVVSGNNYTGAADAESVGILLFQTSKVRVSGNVAFGNNEGILLDTVDHSLIEKNTVSDSSFHGIALFNANDNVVRGNVSRNNGFDGINLDTSTRNLVEGNTAYGNAFFGIGLEASATGNTVRRNRLYDNVGGDLSDVSGNNDVRDNQIGKPGHHGHHGHHGHEES